MVEKAEAPRTVAGPNPLAGFTLNLAKAMLRTGYYAPDHPEAKQSLKGLHAEFRSTVGGQSGITYLVGKTGDGETVMVHGHAEGPEPLDDIMIRGMAELFAPKFLDFFHRRHLVSFSLNAPISADELIAFVVLMSEPPQAGRAQEERGRVEEAILGRHIINVSTVFESDILGRDRRLPWRVEMALSRLGRDLRMLPLYHRASPEEVQRAKIQIIEDLIRPLHAADLLRDLLLNCDLLAADIEGLGSVQIEEEIIAELPSARLQAACRLIADDMLKADPEKGGAPDDLAARRRLVLRHLLLGLINLGAEPDAELVEACVQLGGATFEELPKALRVQLKKRRAVDTFLVRKDEYLRALGSIPPGQEGAPLLKTAEVFFTGLLNRGLYVHAASILEAVGTGNQEGGSAETARELMDTLRGTMADEATLRPMLEGLQNEDHERKVTEALIALVVFAGEPAVKELHDLYGSSESRYVRAHVFEAIKGIGAPSLIPFLAYLHETGDEWSAVHHILTGLAGLGDPALAGPIRPFLKHDNARVRQVALTRTFELQGRMVEGLLIDALGDPDPLVRHTAVAYLGTLPEPGAEAVAYFTSALRPELEGTAPETSEEVLVEICRSLASIAEGAPGHAARFEELLLGALQRTEHGGILGRLHKHGPHFSELVRIAICEALGSFGTERSIEGLTACASEEGAVGEACLAAVGRIQGEGGHDR